MIDSILTEWRFRLESGYPKTKADYAVLRDVILEMTDLTESAADQIVRQAQGITEAEYVMQEEVDVQSIENEELINYLQSVGKLDAFTRILKSIPTALNSPVIDYFNTLPVDRFTIFAKLIYSKDTITEASLNTINYKSGFLRELFNIESDGIGKGEFLLACLYPNTVIQGKETPYDLVQNEQRYEIKNYSTLALSKPIRVGTSAVVTNFEFWDELTMTLKRITQLQGIKTPKFDFRKYFDDTFMEIIDYLLSRKNYILAGNLNNTDKLYFERFYREANQLNSDIEGYTNIILRGPNATPLELSIEPIKKTDDGNLIIKPIEDDSQTITYINTELRRLKYVRDPLEFENDLQSAVDQIAKDKNILYIIFRKDRIRLTNDFRYSRIEQGAIRIIEKSISEFDETQD